MEFIKYFDLCEVKFHLYLNNQPRYINTFGGIMTFIFYIICAFAFILASYDDLKLTNPISSKSEIPNAGLRTVNILKEKIWIPFRMVTYEEQFVDHRGILFPQLYYIEGKLKDKIGMDLKYHLLNYKLCNETSMANKPDSFKINVPLNELFCIDDDDLPFGGSWNGNFIYYLEYNIHLCQDGIHFNASDPRCTKIEDLLANRSASLLIEFYYPVVQFQPTNYEVPLTVNYRSNFYRLATHSNKVERVYISQHILTDDRRIVKAKPKNSSCWGMSSLYGDDYFMEYTDDPQAKSISSRIYSLDIYMDQGMVYYTRTYKKLFLIISDFFPVLRLIFYILKKCTQHIKISFSKRNFASLLFDNANIEKKVNFSKQIEWPNNSSLNHFERKIKFETNNSNSKKELKNNNNEDAYIDRTNSPNENKKPKTINNSFLEQNNSILVKINSENMDKSNIKNNKSNISLNNENLIQILNKQGIANMHLNKTKSLFSVNVSKIKDTFNTHIQKKKCDKKREYLFPNFYFFLDFFFDKINRPRKFCCISKKYFLVYNYMSQIYDISTYLMLFKQFTILNNCIFETINSNEYSYPYESNGKININDNIKLDQLDKESKSKKCIVFSRMFLKN